MDARQKIDMPPLPARCHVVGGHYPDHTDIVDGYSAEQLREFARVYGVNIIATHAAELAAREAEIAGLREALEPFVDYPAETLSLGADEGFTMTVRGFHLHNAVAALTTHPKE